MKKSINAFVCIFTILFFCSFQASERETQEILQKCLETSGFKNILEKDLNGNYLPIYMVTNDLFSENIELTIENEKVQIFSIQGASDFNPENDLIEVLDLKIKENKAILELQYQDSYIKIKMVKGYHDWKYRSIKIKGNKKLYVDISF